MSYGVNILPKTNNTYTLGNSNYKWSNIYAVQINGINVSSLATTATATTSAAGLMSTTDKVKLDGITTMVGATSLAAGTSGLVPAPTTSDPNNYLRGDGTWNQPVVILTYGVSTYSDFEDAFNRGAMIFCRATRDTSDSTITDYTRYATLSYVNPPSQNNPFVTFVYYRRSGLSNTNYCDETYEYSLYSPDVWRTTHQRCGIKQITTSGDGVSINFNKDTAIVTLTTSTFTGATNSTAGTGGMVPAPSAGDETKFLCGDGTWATISGSGTPVSVFTGATSQAAGTSGLVPAPTTSDTAKFLRGDGTWAVVTGGSGGGITGITLASTSLTPDANGVVTIPAMTGCSSSAAGAAGVVPAPSSGDQNKFLAGDGTWKDSEAVILTYDTSTWADFTTAYNANKPIYCQVAGTTSNTTRIAPLVYIDSRTNYRKAEFQYVRSVDVTKGETEDSVIIYTLDASNVWSTDIRPLHIPDMNACTSSADGAKGLVPAPSSGDQDKFLSGDGTWKSGGLPMVILKYGISTWSDFINAYNNNVIVYCRASSNNDPSQGNQLRMAFMAYVNNEASPTEAEFQYYRSVSSHTSSNMCDQIFIYKLHKTNGWSVTTRYAGLREIINNSTAVSLSYSSNKITITDA